MKCIFGLISVCIAKMVESQLLTNLLWPLFYCSGLVGIWIGSTRRISPEIESGCYYHHYSEMNLSRILLVHLRVSMTLSSLLDSHNLFTALMDIVTTMDNNEVDSYDRDNVRCMYQFLFLFATYVGRKCT